MTVTYRFRHTNCSNSGLAHCHFRRTLSSRMTALFVSLFICSIIGLAHAATLQCSPVPPHDNLEGRVLAAALHSPALDVAGETSTWACIHKLFKSPTFDVATLSITAQSGAAFDVLSSPLVHFQVTWHCFVFLATHNTFTKTINIAG